MLAGGFNFAFLIGTAQNPDIKRTTHWYFGFGAGLNFSTVNPIADTTGKNLNTLETSFTMSDTCGNLLFYGYDSLYSKEHNPIGFIPISNTLTEMICVPQPLNDSIYYLFWAEGGTGIFHYAIFNINLNGGQGGIAMIGDLMGSLTDQSSEMCAATYHANNQDIWIVSKKTDSTNLYCWLLTDTGLVTTPVVSSSIISTPISFFNMTATARFSPDGTKMAATYMHDSFTLSPYGDSCYVELYQFNNSTGMFSNPITIQYPGVYMTSFSPDNTKLYAVTNFESVFFGALDTAYLTQYDVSVYNSGAILSSKQIIFQGTDSVFVGIQLGPDGRIYVADFDTSAANIDNSSKKAGVINFPNNSGLSCNYIPDAVDLMGRAHLSFPNFMDSYFKNLNYINCPTGIEESSLSNPGFIIFPNPASEYFTILNQKSEPFSVTIFNAIGESIIKKDVKSSEITFNVKQFTAGIYFIEIISSNQILNYKLLKL